MSYLTLNVISRKPNFSGLVNFPYTSVSPYAAQLSALKLLLSSLLVLLWTVTSA